MLRQILLKQPTVYNITTLFFESNMLEQTNWLVRGKWCTCSLAYFAYKNLGWKYYYCKGFIAKSLSMEEI